MTRFLWLGLALLLAIAGYILFWFYSASQVEQLLANYRAQQQARGIVIAHGDVAVGGFPFRLVAEIPEVTARFERASPPLTWQADKIIAITQPWALNHLIFDLAGKHSVAIADGSEDNVFMADVEKALSSVQVDGSGGPQRLSMTAEKITVTHRRYQEQVVLEQLGTHLRKDEAVAHSWQTALSAATFTILSHELGDPMRLQDIALNARIHNWQNAAFSEEALRAWQADRGHAEIEEAKVSIATAQQPIHLRSEGQLSLDELMRPAGALQATIVGHRVLLKNLRDSGQLPGNTYNLALTAFDLLALGNDGVLEVPLQLADGWVQLGPIRIARLRPLLAP